jgi:ABC-type sugar transport system ATPase subunit
MNLNKNLEEGMFLDGKRVEFRNPGEAIKNRIILIHQELNVIPDMMVYENIFINSQISKKGLLDKEEMIKRTQKLIKDFEADISATDLVKNLTVDKQKLVEVLKAISLDAKVLIMDEPTSMLTSEEAEKLFVIVKNITIKNQIGVVLISHNLGEILDMCNRVTVLRDGYCVGTQQIEELNIDKMVEAMLGRKFNMEVNKRESSINDEMLLKVENLSYRDKLSNVSFELRKGEILGITGLVGSGGSILSKVLFGCSGYKRSKGIVKINGIEINVKSPKEAMNNGIALLTEDRKKEGLILDFNIFENITIPSLEKYTSKLGFLKRKNRIKESSKYFPLLSIKANDSNTVVKTLSGGNQQKIVIAKWLETDPDIIIFINPTVGIDVGAKGEVRKLIGDMAKQGKGIIVITEETSELQSLCDKVLIMFRGKIIKELEEKNICEEYILRYSLGGIK